MLRSARLVVVVSDSFRRQVETYGVSAERIAVLRNWTHITALSVSRDDARRMLGWPRDSFLAVHTGNMGYKQDLGNVIEAARLLHGSPIGVVLVGEGSQRRAIERQAVGLRNVRFTGLVDSATYPLVLAAADVLLVNERPSVQEMSLPSKITSYLAAGRPVIAAIAAGGASARELEDTCGAALIVAPGRPRALAEALRGLVGHDEQLRAMGHSASVYASSHLDRETTLRRLADLVSQVDQGGVGA